ncbi:helix-turn-helix domain-containing protein [Shewanella sp. NFH-SH190041]|uniref:helix-turn-helix domain-containing protein n=1 Tax=Shewanella sp. NFH-SH190041 TaxID=2950245 RepID=UPI0021C465E7|nr:XRE family transcriptional regulator [Shewanella sp. NFH-SH190041]
MKKESKITIGDAVRLARKHRKMTMEQVAVLVPGYDGGNLSRFERNKQDIAKDKLAAVASALNTTVAALYMVAESGDVSIIDRELKPEPSKASVIAALHSVKKVPIISMIHAGQWHDACEDTFASEYRETSARVSTKAFALKVVGDSMTNPYGQPSIPEGAFVIVDPCVEAHSGNIVVAKLPSSNEATLKKLVVDGPNRYLMPLNPNYKPIEINDECQIVGVVKQMEIMF